MVVCRQEHTKKLSITGLVWNPQGNQELAYCDNSGHMGVIDEAIPPEAVASEKEEVGSFL